MKKSHPDFYSGWRRRGLQAVTPDHVPGCTCAAIEYSGGRVSVFASSECPKRIEHGFVWVPTEREKYDAILGMKPEEKT